MAKKAKKKYVWSIVRVDFLGFEHNLGYAYSPGEAKTFLKTLRRMNEPGARAKYKAIKFEKG